MHRHYSFILHVHIITFAKHLISACLIQELCHCVIDALTVTPVFIIFQAIAKLQQGNIGNTKMPCALMMDEMAIRKQLDFDRSADKFVGYVDMGVPVHDLVGLPIAKEALVFLLVSLTEQSYGNKWLIS